MSEAMIVFRESRRGEWRLVWYFPDEGEDGGTLGEKGPISKRLASSSDRDQRELYLIDRALRGARRDGRGFFWSSKEDAMRAMKLARAACDAAESTKPWPDWAVRASAAGWKAPKGWKP